MSISSHASPLSQYANNGTGGYKIGKGLREGFEGEPQPSQENTGSSDSASITQGSDQPFADDDLVLDAGPAAPLEEASISTPPPILQPNAPLMGEGPEGSGMDQPLTKSDSAPATQPQQMIVNEPDIIKARMRQMYPKINKDSFNAVDGGICPLGYALSGNLCYENCPANYKDDGKTCARSSYVIDRPNYDRGGGVPYQRIRSKYSQVLPGN